MQKIKKINKPPYLLCAAYVIVFLAFLCGLSQFLLLNYRFTKTIDKDSYQAVFLTSGQIYFGRLEFVRRDYLVLNDVYYVQLDQSLQTQAEPTTEDAAGESTAAPERQFVLYELGEELHEPQQQLIINRDHLIFWENLKPDSRIIKSIQERKK